MKRIERRKSGKEGKRDSRLSDAMNGKRSKAKKGEHERGRALPRGPAGLVLEAVLGGGGGRSGLSAFDVCWG